MVLIPLELSTFCIELYKEKSRQAQRLNIIVFAYYIAFKVNVIFAP